MTLNKIDIKSWILREKLYICKKVKTLKKVKFRSTPFTMNSFVTSVVIGVVAIFGATSAQQGPCGCAPQPTVIQLSCGGGSQPNNGPSHPPPPPPAPEFTTPGPSWGDDYTTTAYHTGLDPNDLMNMCEFDAQGNPISNPPGGFPAGFRVPVDSDGTPHPVAPEGYPVPPQDWDGRMETLGFPMPQPGTAHFNMFVCYPMPMVSVPVIGN